MLQERNLMRTDFEKLDNIDGDDDDDDDEPNMQC